MSSKEDEIKAKLEKEQMLSEQSEQFNQLSTKQKEVLRAINTNDYQYLLDLGAIDNEIDMNFPVTADGMNPLILACCFGSKIITQVILKNKKTNINIVDNHGNNALYYAAFYGHHHIIEELCLKEIEYKMSSNGVTPLHIAAQRGHLEAV